MNKIIEEIAKVKPSELSKDGKFIYKKIKDIKQENDRLKEEKEITIDEIENKINAIKIYLRSLEEIVENYKESE